MHKAFALFTLGCLLIATTGCQPESTPSAAAGHGHEHGHDHDHGARPASLHAAVAQLTEIRDEVRTAMEAGKPDDAHHPLHEVGELLEVLPEVAADSDLSKEQWEEVKIQVDSLFDGFGQIDKAFHQKDGDKVAAYDGAKTTIDEAIAAIEALLPHAGQADRTIHNPAGDDHSHDDHDHHDHSDHDEHDDHDL